MVCPRLCGRSHCTHDISGKIPTQSIRTNIFGRSKVVKPKPKRR